MKIKINEAFRSIGGDHQPEYGVLQEAAENIIPPAFNRLVDYAKLGAPPPGEANVPGQPGLMSSEELQAAFKKMMDERVKERGLKKPAQDTMAQLIVRYAGRPYRVSREGGSVDFALNPAAVSNVFKRSFQSINPDLWWRSYRKHVLGMPEKDAELTQDQKRTLINTDQLNTWREVKKEKVEKFELSFHPQSPTPQQWLQKTRKMAVDGASAQEILVVLGQQYKSYLKTMKKWFKRNPEFIDVQPRLMEIVRRQWNRWQSRLISHAHNNFRKIAAHLHEDDSNYQEINALIKKYPSRNEVDPFTRDIIQKNSLYHINELIDNELLKKQLDMCPKGWTEVFDGNKDGDGAPCILHKYDDGFFWWNRKASSCDIAGEEMANCGASNYDDSTLLILKEFVQNDSMNVRDKTKGRVMVEYNPGYKGSEFVQILGFANSFPEEKYWEKIRDLYENLRVGKVSDSAFQYLRSRGKATQDDIDRFFAYMKGADIGEAPPQYNNFEEFLEAVKGGETSLSTEDEFGGSIYMNFRMKHETVNDYHPIEVGGAIEKTFNVGADSEYPSVDRSIYEGDTGDLAEFLAEAFPKAIMNVLKGVFRDFDPLAGTLDDNINERRVNPRTIRIRLNKLDQMTDDTEPDRLQVRLPFAFEIPAEMFTNEDLRVDEVDFDKVKEVFGRIKRNFEVGAFSNALYSTVQLQNARVNPEGYTTFIPGVDDQPEGEMVLNVDEAIEEMREIELAAGNGVPMDRLQDRLEVLYRSFVTPTNDGTGYMIIDQINDETKMRWARFIRDDDFWSDEFERIYSDSQDRIAAMRNDGPDEEERNWRPGMPTPGLRQTDYQDQDLQPNPGAEQVGDATDLLLNRGNMLLRLYGEQPERINDAVLQIFRRFKSQMQEAGLWDEWWNNVDDNHPFKRFPLEEDKIMVEATAIVNKILGEKKSGVEKTHMNERNDIRKGGVLPFKKENGEFYFLLGQAPQGWWSDFRGGEEPEDGGDLKVTAAREFKEESSFDLPVSLDDAHRLEHKNAAVYLTDLAEIDAEDFDVSKVMKINKGRLAGTPEIVAVGWYHIEELPSIAKSRMPIIEKAIQLLTAPEPTAIHTGMAHGRAVGGDAYTPFLNESEGVKTLHIFDFDDTIAFTETFTKVTAPNGKEYDVGQKGLDKLLKSVDGGEDELIAKGFKLDFSGFKTVDPDSRLNPVIVDRIASCCQAGSMDPEGDFYVLTARSAAAEGPIHQYLADNDIEIERSKVIGVEGKSKASRIKSLISGTDVNKVIFYDDSQNNIKDVAGLRQDPDLENVVFELYPVDHSGNIPKKPMQETIYERKTFKIRIGAK